MLMRQILTAATYLSPLLYRQPHGIPPLGPGAVVIAHFVEAEQVGEGEPGVGGPLADPAIGDCLRLRTETVVLLVEFFELLGRTERVGIGIDGLGPGNALRARNVASAQAPLLRILRHVGLLAPELLRTPHVHQLTLLPEMGQHVFPERANSRIVPLLNS